MNKRYSNLEPYTPGEQPQDRSYIKLNTNESPYPPSESVLRVMKREEAENLRLYSDPQAKKLKQALADFYDVKPENVFVSNGSDESLNFSFMAFAQEGGQVAFPAVSYGFYPVFAELHHLKMNAIPLKEDFTIDPKDYENIGMPVVIANPNAPTGLMLTPDQIEEIAKSNPDQVVLIDEAYVDFGAETVIPLTKKYDNLLAVQTYSKSRSLAGARLGYAIGDAELIRDLETVKYSTNPYNVSRLTLELGYQALQDPDYYRANCQKIMDSRAWTIAELRKRGFQVLESKTNFVFARTDAKAGKNLYLELKDQGILVRHFDDPKITDWVRITIGSQDQMEALIEKLDVILSLS